MADELALPCAAKLAFDTQKQAIGAAAAITFKHGTELVPYHCPHCGLWHLSSQ